MKNKKEEKITVINEPVSKEFQKEFFESLERDEKTYYETNYLINFEEKRIKDNKK